MSLRKCLSANNSVFQTVEDRFEALTDKLPYATKLETQLEAIGANLDYRHVDGIGKTRGHYELALKPGPGFKPIGAGVDRSTGEAVILFPECPLPRPFDLATGGTHRRFSFARIPRKLPACWPRVTR